MHQSKHSTTWKNHSPSSQLGLFADVWNTVECGMYVMEVLGDGEEFRYIAFNPAMTKILLIPIEDILGKTMTEVMGNRGYTCHKHFRECFLTGKVLNYEERFEFNGKVHFWSLTIAPIRNEEGVIHQMVVTAHDISDRKQAETQLKEKEDFLLSIYDGCNNPIFVIDILANNQFVLVGCNSACEKNIKLSSSQIAGKTTVELFGVEIGTKMQQLYMQCIDSGSPISYEEYIIVDGQRMWGLTTINSVKDSDGKIYRLIGTTTNITELKNIQTQVETKAQELEDTIKKLASTQAQLIQTEKMSSLGQLVAGIAHEINNPSCFIYGNITFAQEYIHRLLDLLKLYRESYPQATELIQLKIKTIELDFIIADLPGLLESIQEGSERITEIVTSLRNFSRIDEAEYKKVDIHAGINNTLRLLEHRLKAQNQRPQIQVIKEFANLPLIECYAGQLNQVFMNILANAIDALDESQTLQPQIQIRTQMSPANLLTITISNNGMVIPKDVQTKIFDPFFTTKKIGKGTGMGLSISYQIITKKHGGTLECISAADNSTEFVIKIPQKVNFFA